MKRHFRNMMKEYEEGKLDFEHVQLSVASYKGYFKHGNTYHFKKKIFDDFVLRRKSLDVDMEIPEPMTAWVEDYIWQNYIDASQFVESGEGEFSKK